MISKNSLVVMGMLFALSANLSKAAFAETMSDVWSCKVKSLGADSSILEVVVGEEVQVRTKVYTGASENVFTKIHPKKSSLKTSNNTLQGHSRYTYVYSSARKITNIFRIVVTDDNSTNISLTEFRIGAENYAGNADARLYVGLSGENEAARKVADLVCKEKSHTFDKD